MMDLNNKFWLRGKNNLIILDIWNNIFKIIIIFSSDGLNITKNEFYDYYLDVNAVIPIEKEDYFKDVLISTWGVTSSYDYISP
jgi:hypothetical protein